MYDKLSAPTANEITVRPHAPAILLQNPTRKAVIFSGLLPIRHCVAAIYKLHHTYLKNKRKNIRSMIKIFKK